MVISYFILPLGLQRPGMAHTYFQKLLSRIFELSYFWLVSPVTWERVLPLSYFLSWVARVHTEDRWTNAGCSSRRGDVLPGTGRWADGLQCPSRLDTRACSSDPRFWNRSKRGKTGFNWFPVRDFSKFNSLIFQRIEAK